MAKTNGTAKWVMVVIVLAGICVTAGGIIATVYDHDDRLDKIEPEVEAQGKAIIRIQSDLKYIITGVDELRGKNP